MRLAIIAVALAFVAGWAVHLWLDSRDFREGVSIA